MRAVSKAPETVARDLVQKKRWRILGWPDVHAQQIDREVAIGAAVVAEQTRRQKASKWQPPAVQLWQEIAMQYDREQAAQEVAAREA